MLSPNIPENETERLNTLQSLNVLDTDAEERFDRITRIARKLFDVPIALVSLIDAQRQWFKSTQGLDAQETSREISFCGHAILTDEMMIVEDASQDKRFHDNPLVLGNPNIRFYLGCPLKINDTHNIGTLCLIDNKCRQFSTKDLIVMRDLADMVQAELESIQLSTTDELTKLSNRRGFLLIANHAFNICQREDRMLTLLFFDLDKFKYINDTFGHAEGDGVLKLFSQFLLTQFRSSDIIARLGGDEFCVLCSGIKEENIQILLNRFQGTLNAYQNKEYDLRYSVGCIQYDRKKHRTINDLLADADTKMYEHKRKNRL